MLLPVQRARHIGTENLFSTGGSLPLPRNYGLSALPHPMALSAHVVGSEPIGQRVMK
jgi:hypothetical protein